MALVIVPQVHPAAAALTRAAAAAPAVDEGSRTASTPSIAGAAAPARVDWGYVWLGVALVVIGGFAGNGLVSLGHYTFTPRPGVSVFAVFYVFAQALERVTELLTLVFPGAGKTSTANGAGATTSGAPGVSGGGATTITKQSAGETRDKQLAAAMNDPSPANVNAAAAAQAVLERIRLNRTLLIWTATSAAAMVGAGWLGLRLIAAISSSDASPTWLDVVITGLVIGGGTKPLHDLIGSLQDSRKASADPTAAQAS